MYIYYDKNKSGILQNSFTYSEPNIAQLLSEQSTLNVSIYLDKNKINNFLFNKILNLLRLIL